MNDECNNCNSDSPKWRFLGCTKCEKINKECTIKICVDCGDTLEF